MTKDPQGHFQYGLLNIYSRIGEYMLEFVEHTPANLFQVNFYFMSLHVFRGEKCCLNQRFCQDTEMQRLIWLRQSPASVPKNHCVVIITQVREWKGQVENSGFMKFMQANIFPTQARKHPGLFL